MRGCPCFDDPACSAERRCRVPRSSVRPSSLETKGLPEALERAAELPSASLYWSSVSVLVRWRLHGSQRDEHAAHAGSDLWHSPFRVANTGQSAGISRGCTGSSNHPDIVRSTPFLPLLRRILSLRMS